MRALVTLTVLVSWGCLPAADWAGRWAGNVAVDTGGVPRVYGGGVSITAAGRFDLVAEPVDGRGFSFGLQAFQVEPGAASFTTPVTLTLEAAPPGDCTRSLELASAAASRDGEAMFGVATGRLHSDCAGDDPTLDFSLTLSAARE